MTFAEDVKRVVPPRLQRALLLAREAQKQLDTLNAEHEARERNADVFGRQKPTKQEKEEK